MAPYNWEACHKWGAAPSDDPPSSPLQDPCKEQPARKRIKPTAITGSEEKVVQLLVAWHKVDEAKTELAKREAIMREKEAELVDLVGKERMPHLVAAKKPKRGVEQ